MGLNSTEVAYSFGQMGSVYHNSDDVAITSDSSGIAAAHDPIPTGAVFVAITFLEDSTFDALGGLVAENVKHYISTEGTSLGVTASGGSVVDTPVLFPEGVTIYGRWTEIDLASGGCIAYIGY